MHYKHIFDVQYGLNKLSFSFTVISHLKCIIIILWKSIFLFLYHFAVLEFQDLAIT